MNDDTVSLFDLAVAFGPTETKSAIKAANYCLGLTDCGAITSTICCADCGNPVCHAGGPPDGWQLEDGRTVCQPCCAIDLRKFSELLVKAHKESL